MGYKAIIDIDDDRWCKRPYGITIMDENGNQVERCGNLTSRDACYRYSDKYDISRREIEEEFY